MELLMGFSVFGCILMIAAYVDGRRGAGDDRLGEWLGVEKKNAIELAEQAAPGLRTRFLRSGLLKKVEMLARAVVPAQALDDIGRRLEQAGGIRNLTREEFYSLKIIGAAGLFGIVSSLMIVGSGARGLLSGVGAAALGYIVPDLWLNNKVGKRKRGIESALLSYVDMLAVACDAGVSLQDAVIRVSDYANNTLGEEMRRTIKEANIGRPMAEALLALGERNGVDDLHLLASALAQAIKHGTPIAQVLRDQAAQLRQLRRTRAQELAQKASVKMLGPIVLLEFGPMMALLLGPAVLNLLRALGF